MKCDSCWYRTGYTLGPDECGAGDFFEYCSKGHWEGGGPRSKEEEAIWESSPDPWADCTDYLDKEQKESEIYIQKFIEQLYNEEPSLKKEGLSSFDGYFVHYDKVINAVCNAWGGRNPGYNSDPLELIGNLINERDEWKRKARMLAGTKDKPCSTCKWDDFETYLSVDFDPCQRCKKGSYHNKGEEVSIKYIALVIKSCQECPHFVPADRDNELATCVERSRVFAPFDKIPVWCPLRYYRPNQKHQIEVKYFRKDTSSVPNKPKINPQPK